MYVAPEKAAESFGITVKKLEKIRKRKDCPENIVDPEGFYNTEIVGQMLVSMQEQAKRATAYVKKRRLTDKTYGTKRRGKNTAKQPSGNRYSDADRAKALQLLHDGSTQSNVAGVLGCSLATVQNWQKAAGKKSKKVRCRRNSRPRQKVQQTVQESLEEYAVRFWETDQRWLDFVTQDLNEAWFRHFIGEALRFGHETAYPEE